MGLDSTNEDSTLDMTLAWRGLIIMMEEVHLSMKFSMNFTCSVIGLCVKRPPTVLSRHRSACVSIPKQKSHNNILSVKDKSRLACINGKNLAQATPIDSSYC